MTVRTSRFDLFCIYWLITFRATALFVDVPHPSISYIYQSIGCQHVLHYTGNDFEPPSIPALTPRGFVRWESIETLLGPEEHVPFLQAAVRNFGIKHPDTGEPFPVDLPKEAFPLKADPEIERWHNECAEKLRRQASPPDESDRKFVRPSIPVRPEIRSGYSHLRSPVSPGRVPREQKRSADYFSSRTLRYQHVPSRHANGPSANRGSSYRPYLSPEDGAPQSPNLRRRSFPENYYSPDPTITPTPAAAQPVKPCEEGHSRRHSHPRHRLEPSTPSSSSGSDTEPGTSDEPTSPTTAPRSSPQTNTKRPTSTIHVSVPSTTSSVGGSYPNHNPPVPDTRQRVPSYKVPVDASAKLPPQFMQSARHIPAPSNVRVGTVRWGSTSERTEFPRRGSLNLSATVEDADEDDDEEEQRRNWDRDRRRGDGRVRLVQGRSGSHDGRYSAHDSDRRGRDRDKERYSDRDEKDLDRRREKNRVASPSKGMDWRKYIPEMLR